MNANAFRHFYDCHFHEISMWSIMAQISAQLLRLLNDVGVKTEYRDYIFYTHGHPYSFAHKRNQISK